MDRNFIGASKRLDDLDLPRLGALIGVGEDEIHAFIDVETRGHGFDDKGRPIILFERHKFYEYVPAAKRTAAVNAGLASKTPGGYGSQADQYPKLLKAIDIDETAALKSCSWGLGQVLGANFADCGYDSVQDFVKGMMADEDIQLKASIDFIIKNGLGPKLKAHDWAGFAAGYNGKNYRINQYDTKLADAYRKWSRIKDTPWPEKSPVQSLPAPPAIPEPPKPESPLTPAVVAQVPIPPATDPVAAKVPDQNAAVVVAVPQNAAPTSQPVALSHPSVWASLAVLAGSAGTLIAHYLGVH